MKNIKYKFQNSYYQEKLNESIPVSINNNVYNKIALSINRKIVRVATHCFTTCAYISRNNCITHIHVFGYKLNKK